jgi:hypothetical protein
MLRREGLRRACARRPASLVGLVLTFALALAFMAPMLLGPALGPLSRALGGAAQHLCACGMVPGTCGCPECERLERQRELDKSPRPYRTLTSQCNDGEIAAGFPALPPAVPLATFTLSAPPPRELASIPSPPSARSRDPVPPPTPPPRALAV